MAESKDLGTLIVVVGKARNLPNKSRFGKQDPFCTVKVGEEKQRTKAIKRGGQHPEWDEELRFTIIEDVDDVLVRSESQPDNSLFSSTSHSLSTDSQPGVTTAAALANKSRKGPITKKGVKSMKVAVYADDAKEPELIGECIVNIEEVLKKGEVDEWYEFLYKEKYSGEVYLELTFYSNNAPPVKRNVPRPAVNAFGGIEPTSSPSSSSLAGRHRASGGLSVSGSVSGMSLYIPPYVQPARVPSPIPEAIPSNSFAELGLPTRKQSLPHHKIAQLTSSPSANPQSPYASQNPLDSLTRPMASMSLGMSHTSRPLPSATPIPAHLNHATSPHRHSVGGHFEVPWGSLLPQAQPPPSLKPHSRPLSGNDVVPWDQWQRSDEESRTPLPRPFSGQGFSPSNVPPHQSASRAPSPLSSTLLSTAPRERRQPNSFSHAAGPAGPSNYYRQPSPVPTPPPHPSTAPPVAYTTGHYHVPTSSYAGLSQSHVDPIRMPSPQPAYQQSHASSQQYDPTRAPLPSERYQTPQPESDYRQGYARPPSRNGSFATHQAPEPQQHPYVEPQYPSPHYLPHSSTPQPYYNAAPESQIYSHLQQTMPPPRQSSPAPLEPAGYVPWYQQTQSANQPYPAAPEQFSQSYSQQQPHYGSPPHSGPSRRPVPHPPAPQRPQHVGYYPSDELYAEQRSNTPQAPAELWSWHAEDYPSYPSAQNHSSATPSPLPFSPPSRYASSPRPPLQDPQTWQGQQGHQRTPSPQPPRENYHDPHPQCPHDPYPAQSQPHAYPPPRAPSPQPPLFTSHRSPSPSPSAKQDWRSYMQNLPSASPSPGATIRSPSPQPPPKDQQTWYTPPPSLPASIRPPEGWRSTLPAQANGHQWRG